MSQQYDAQGRLIEAFVTIYRPIAGWKSQLISWDEEVGDYIPWSTGCSAFATPTEAEKDAQWWAQSEEIHLLKDGQFTYMGS